MRSDRDGKNLADTRATLRAREAFAERPSMPKTARSAIGLAIPEGIASAFRLQTLESIEAEQ